MSGDHSKMALALATLAYQLHATTMTLDAVPVSEYPNSPSSSHLASQYQAVEAFTIIAYFCFLVAFILLLEINFADLKGNKMAGIVAVIFLVIAVISVLILVITFGAYYDNTHLTPMLYRTAYSTTVYITAAAAGIGSIVLLVMSMKKK